MHLKVSFHFTQMHFYKPTRFTKMLRYLYLVKEYKLYQKSISRKLHILVLSYVYTMSFTERRKQRAHIQTHLLYIQTSRHMQRTNRKTQMHKHTITHKYNDKRVISQQHINEGSSVSFLHLLLLTFVYNWDRKVTLILVTDSQILMVQMAKKKPDFVLSQQTPTIQIEMHRDLFCSYICGKQRRAHN